MEGRWGGYILRKVSYELIQKMGWLETPENVPVMEWISDPGSTLGGHFAWLSHFLPWSQGRSLQDADWPREGATVGKGGSSPPSCTSLARLSWLGAQCFKSG